ncbi:NAD(P)/FAD-dependent oxidoreductase [Clostridium sp.]|uniref:NAD(P)/FAD-dependent oxidoreductase n=1 Tax=Clostridium sp. TaxID=1506 RepID=UPI003463AA3A
MIHHDIIIIGGGASGVFSAINCKDFGMYVAILEGTDRICKKILTTGNGRCNITNEFIKYPFINYHSDEKDFFIDTLSSFSVEDTLSFFSGLGLPIMTLENGKMYPMSLQASSVIDIIRFALEEREIPVYLNHKVRNIKKQNGKYIISITNSDNTYSCDKLVIACGGKTAQSTGSDGSGYTLLKSLGHGLIEPLPALVQLKLDHSSLKALSGVKFNGYAEILVDGKAMRKEYGEILFTDYGISGPPILQLSRIASKALYKSREVKINIDMIPDESLEDLTAFIDNHFGTFSYRSVFNAFIGLINKKLIPILLKEATVDNIHKPCYSLSFKEKSSIIKLLKSWEFRVIGTNPFNNAQVTCGGINTKEICNKTLESKLMENLYLCGEVLDVDGDCGGFNLQWAWSSGFKVSKSIYDKNKDAE